MAEAAAPNCDEMLTTMLALAAADNEKENEHAGEADPRAKSALGKRTRSDVAPDGQEEEAEADQAQKRGRTEPPTPVPYIGEPAAARPAGVAPDPAEHESKPATLNASCGTTEAVATEAAATEAANKPAEAANKPAARRTRAAPRPTSGPPLPAAPKAVAKNDKAASEPALQSFPCPVEGCTYVAHRRSHLAQHRQRHSDARPFVCTYPGCSYAAKRAVTLLEHKRTHTGEKPYSCTVPGCTYKAAQRTTLRSHIQRRHSNRPKPPPRKDANAAKLMILLEQTTDADTKVDRAKQAKLQGKAKSKGKAKAKAPSSAWPMSGTL